MKNPFRIGETLVFEKVVQETEIAAFESGIVHHVYSTFCLAKDAEWSTRLFVLEMKEEDEEGIGTFIEVYHRAPAMVNSTVKFTATLDEVNGHEIVCSFVATVGDRIIAEGRTGQKILKKTKINSLLEKL